MRFRRRLEREAAKIYAEEKEVAEHEGRELNKKKLTSQIESDSDESDLEKILDNTPQEDTVQNKDMEGNMPNDRENNREANDIMQKKSDVPEDEGNDIMQNKGDVAENDAEIMQNQNEAEEENEGKDIMQNQSVETDNSANKGEASDNMQNNSDTDNAENDANYLKQIEKEQRRNKRKLRSSNKKSKKKKIEVPPSSRVLHSHNSTPAAPKKYSDVVMDSVEKAKSGNLNISSFHLRRRKRHQRQFVCCCCKQKLSSTSELTKHMKEKHLDYKYTCKKCSKHFGTKNGLYKHVLLHSGKRYSCNTCGKLFYWQCELKDHMRKHTAKPAQRVSCPVRGCKKTYSSKHALQRHTRDDHNPPSVIVCDFIDKDGKVCGKESKNKTLYKQHFIHAHTPGFQSHCGEYFPWPKKCNEHQNECTLCGKVAAKKNRIKKER